MGMTISLNNNNSELHDDFRSKNSYSRYKHQEILPNGLTKIKKHNHLLTRCSIGCSNPDCYHGELGFINEHDEKNNYFFVDKRGKIV
ncbi:hypothetical protein QJ850_gp298 [Acanthamoeba polyphaga mimivirus]|uniref:Uncharacterized protein n=1 Tax=Acanthamoeba polyphaga mimivirus Kroon TaxID=3069720 RepID=A0A0G2YBE0_9VIRU|nr:hypothetical protein QJ850_gp298 [Acanthamoeba polyphaga mimivirus]AKI80401.1 hypothetical protein [Acanthamoeba polyphaga mimivirus Kroon]